MIVCRLPKPPWLSCIETVGSWFETKQLTDGFLLEASPWVSDHALNDNETLQARLWFFKCSESDVFVLQRAFWLLGLEGAELLLTIRAVLEQRGIFPKVNLGGIMSHRATWMGYVGKEPKTSSESTVIQWKQGFSSKLNGFQVPWSSQCQQN